ncbi:MAG TPA: ABC transporter substrate-binding protein [Planctomycetota bacterium]|nr:ABC transporter substrate-binding protein [Planctomycetota bacterium]
MKRIALVLLILAPQEAEPLRIVWPSVRTVDPALASDPSEVRLAEALFDGLSEAKVEGAVVTFALPDRKWSDGRPVTAGDYRFAWLRCLQPSTGSPWAFRFRHIRNARAFHDAARLADRLLLYESEGPSGRAEIARLAKESGSKRHARGLKEAAGQEKDGALKAALEEALGAAEKREDLGDASVGIEAVDARTLRVTLEAPRPGFPELAATTPFLPVPEHVVRERREKWTHSQNLVTCGAYRLERWVRDEIVLVRAGAGEGPGRISIRLRDRITEGWALYERGEVDWIDASLVPPEKVESLVAAGEIRTAPGPAVMFLRFSASVKPGLRRAVALAIDRDALAKKAGPGAAESRTLTGAAEAPARDLAAALTALAAEFPDLKPPRIRLLTWKGGVAETAGRALREQLEEALALAVRLDLREGVAYVEGMTAGDYDLAIVAFAPEAGDPSGALDLLPEGRALGEKKVLEAGLAVPLLREGPWFAAKPRVQAKPGTPLSRVGLKK